MTQISFIYFDIGGTLCNTDKLHPSIAALLGCPVGSMTKRYDAYAVESSYGRITTAEYWQKLRAEFNPKAPALVDLPKVIAEALEPIPPMQSLVLELSKSYPIGLLTDIQKGVFENLEASGKLPQVQYAVIIKSCDVGLKKPQAEIYRLAQRRAGFAENKILFVDDLQKDIDGARAMGWNGVLCETGNVEKTIGQIRAIV